jgi:hypothetical protein
MFDGSVKQNSTSLLPLCCDVFRLLQAHFLQSSPGATKLVLVSPRGETKVVVWTKSLPINARAVLFSTNG